MSIVKELNYQLVSWLAISVLLALGFVVTVRSHHCVVRS